MLKDNDNKMLNLNEMAKIQIYSKNCADPLRGSIDFWIGESRVVSAACGVYRETAAADNARFGYRFHTPFPKLPHLLEMDYPDDRARVICVQDGVSYDLTAGVVIGGDIPNTGKMKTLQTLFWPRAADLSVLICSVCGREPAAAANICVYALEALPRQYFPDTRGNRSFGVQYEDPCNVGASEGSAEFQDWLEKHIAFMKLTGQNRLVYPVNWYHGPIVPVKSQPCSRFSTVVTPDRRCYVRSTQTPPDWADALLSRFDREGFLFSGSLTLLRLGGLMEKMNTDADAVIGGADTVNNVLYNGQIQGSCNDWTVSYNPLNFPMIAAHGEAARELPYAYGEKSTSDLCAPIFNCLHPEVRRQVREYIRELAEKYAAHPSFTGLTVNFWHGTVLWFGNLLCGYDDGTTALFARETGVSLPGKAGDPARFYQRFKFLTERCREQWIAWRCRKVHAFLCELRDILREARPDLVLTLNVWNETSGMCYYPGKEGFPGAEEWDKQCFARPSNYEIYRWGGLELSLFENEPGIALSVERDFCRDISLRDGRPCYSQVLTDPMWLDETLFETLKGANNTEGFHFNCWVERWGRIQKLRLRRVRRRKYAIHPRVA